MGEWTAASAQEGLSPRRHDPLAYLQNWTVDWLDHQLAVAHAVFEVRCRQRLLTNRLEQVEDSVRECVLVTDDVSGRPLASNVGMCGLGGENGAKAAAWSLVDVKLKLVHAFQIKRDAAAAAINLKAIVVLAARSEARAFDAPDSAAFEFPERAPRRPHRP